jgi:hypothetical protein
MYFFFNLWDFCCISLLVGLAFHLLDSSAEYFRVFLMAPILLNLQLYGF